MKLKKGLNGFRDWEEEARHDRLEMLQRSSISETDVPDDESTGSLIKRDVLLSNMDLPDVEVPIIWHGLQRSPDGILRQALLSADKEPKGDDKLSQRAMIADASSSSPIIGINEPLFPQSQVITVSELEDAILIGGGQSPAAVAASVGGVEAKARGGGVPTFEANKKKSKLRRRQPASTPVPKPPVISVANLGGPALDAPPTSSPPAPGGVLAQAAQMMTHDPVHLANEGSYTVHLLSQLSGVLPAMSSSQVSSVLSALEPTDGQAVAQNGQDDTTTKPNKPAVERAVGFVKSETPSQGCQPKRGVRKKARTVQPTSPVKSSAVEWRSGKLRWYTCSGCQHLAADRAGAERHCAQGRCRAPRSTIKCIACSNTVCSLHSLKGHLLSDHDVSSEDVHSLLVVCVEVNKTWRAESKLKQDKCVSDTEFVKAVQDLTSPERNSKVSITVQLPTVPEFSLFETVDKYIGEPAESDRRPGDGKVADDRRVGGDGDGDKDAAGGKGGNTTARKSGPKKLTDIKIEKQIGLRCTIEGCSARFVYNSNMEYHKQCHEGVKWKCPECDIACPTWGNLSVHLWRLHAIDMELYSCAHCPYKTNSLSKLMNLHTRIHGEERPFLCDLCGKGFKTTKQLRNHKGVHRAKERLSRDLECGVCGRCFSDRRMLRHHTDIVHGKLRPFLCSICGHAAASRSSLRMHARMHTGEKPYRCSECDYTTADHNSLRRHKMRHSGTKHYQCPHCPYACIQSSTYKSHLKNKHPGLDEGFMFSCNLCSFRTVKKENFLTHASCHSASIDSAIKIDATIDPLKMAIEDQVLNPPQNLALPDVNGDLILADSEVQS